jgi:pimeloyl-ACP methyl ester carboxylesterase
MRVERHTILNGNVRIPNVVLAPEPSSGAVVVVHGYGGSKEEVLGLSWRLAEAGFTAIAIDLRGHGEHPLPLDSDVLSDLEASLAHARRFGDVTAVGHSLGGRLALLSSSARAIGISPALPTDFDEGTRHFVKSLRGHRVREQGPDTLFATLHDLPEWAPAATRDCALLYGTRDIPEILRACQALDLTGVRVKELPDATHGDTCMIEGTFQFVAACVREWYGIS